MLLATGIRLRHALLLAAICGLASGRPALAAPDAAVVNPTGRVLEMIAPLNFASYYLGDLAVRIRPDQEVEIPRPALLAAVRPLLRTQVFEALAAVGADAPDDHHTLSGLRRHGFDFRFDPGAVAIVFTPTLDQKLEGEIVVQAARPIADSPNAAEPAELSAFLNLRSALDYIGDTPHAREGLRAPRLDLEGAMRWQGVVLEAEGTFEPEYESLFGERGDGFRRRGTRLVRDFEEEAVRATLGDVYPIGSSLQYTPDLLGISIERSTSKLQPGKAIRTTSRRSFRLERPSSVDVVVNGLTVRQLRLEAGDYNLSDLPVSVGANEMVLEIEDDVGQRQTLEFSSFLDSALLPAGLSEWAFAAGLPAAYELGEPDYTTDEIFLTGFYRRGLADAVTGEAHLQTGSALAMGGLGLMFGSSLGFFALEAAGSVEVGGGWGAAFSGDYTLANIEDGAGRLHSIRLSAEARTAGFDTPRPAFGLDEDDAPLHADWLELSASYSAQLPYRISAALSGGYGFGFAEDGDSHHAGLSVSRAFGRDVSMGLSGGYAFRGEEADLNLLLRLQYRPDRNSALTAAFDAGQSRSGIAYDRRFGRGVGSWQTSIDLTHQMPEPGYGAEDAMSANAALHYTGNRANVSLTQDSRFIGPEAASTDQRTSLRVETGIAFADGQMALGRPVAGGFAIIGPAAGLDGNDISIGDSAGVVARTDWLGPALLPSVSAYRMNRVDYDVADLPPGYDLGEGLFELMPKHRSGYRLSVGSDYTVTAQGTLIGAPDRPVGLLTGVAIAEADPARQVELFTNREGRFTAQGLAPGRWVIEMATEPMTRFRLDIPADTVGLYRAEALRPL